MQNDQGRRKPSVGPSRGAAPGAAGPQSARSNIADRNPFFTGLEPALAQLQEALAGQGRAALSEPSDTFDIFLSHAHLDAEAVELLGVRLEDEAHLRVWLDRWVLVPGEHWQQEMAKGLDQAKTCAVCVGSHTPEGWFREEIERALNRQTKDKGFRVIPVILPNGDRALIDNFLELRT